MGTSVVLSTIKIKLNIYMHILSGDLNEPMSSSLMSVNKFFNCPNYLTRSRILIIYPDTVLHYGMMCQQL